MKLNITFKTPDALYYPLAQLNEDDKAKVEELLQKWVKWGEQVVLQLDTETETIEVLETGCR